MIADTSFIIDLARQKKEAREKLQHLIDRRLILKLTVVTVFELWGGLYRARNYTKEARIIFEVISGKEILPLDELAARVSGKIDGILSRQGARIGTRDVLIAGIALTANEELVTRNIKHFSRVPGLKLESY
jgi:predicted nucleic acid-binding protein